MTSSKPHCRIMPLSNTNIRKLHVIVGRLDLQEVEQMAHISRTCLNNALSGSRLQATHRLSIEQVIDLYFERHPEELPLAMPPEPAKEATPAVPKRGPTECLVEGDCERICALITVASAMGLRVTV